MNIPVVVYISDYVLFLRYSDQFCFYYASRIRFSVHDKTGNNFFSKMPVIYLDWKCTNFMGQCDRHIYEIF